MSNASQKADFRSSTASGGKKPKPTVFRPVDSRSYLSLYGPTKIDRFNDLDAEKGELGNLFLNGRSTHNVPLVTRQPREVLPGLFSFQENAGTHQPVLHFLRTLSKELNAAFVPDVDDEGFTTTGVFRTFDHLRCPAGYLQNPMSVKTVDNSLLRKELGLSDGYTVRQQQIATAVWRLIWKQAKPSPVNVPKLSAGGMPRFTHDHQWKMDHISWKTRPDVYDGFLRAVEKADVRALFEDFGCLYGMYGQKRVQLDSVGKERLANDWAYALSGGKRGARTATDKKVEISGIPWSDFAALRCRNIDAGPWSINCDLQIVATAHMHALFELYPKTFHVNSASDISSVIEGFPVYCSDVSEYDQSMSRDAVATVFATMREVYPEGVVRSAERLYTAPFFTKPVDMRGTKGMWSGDPRDWSVEIHSGNRSGAALTSLMAKGNKVVDSLFIIDLVTPLPLKDVELEQEIARVWRHLTSIRLVNNGDDEIVIFQDERLKRVFLDKRSDRSAGHYVVEPEAGQGFSGLTLVRPDPSVHSYVPMPRLSTSFEKSFIPERSVGGKLRPYWPVGWYDRLDTLSRTDAGRQALDIMFHCYRVHIEPVIGSLTSVLARGYDRLPVSVDRMSSVDRLVLDDPDVLHYKFADSDVSGKVLDLVTSRFPAHESERFLRRYYSGVFV